MQPVMTAQRIGSYSPRTIGSGSGRRRCIVGAVDLKIKGGEIVGIAGVSGNGQSELIEAISGQRPIRDGRIFVNGKPFVIAGSAADCPDK